MRLICTEPDSGKLLLEEVPEPIPGPGMVRVITKSSVISSGTEKAVIELARSSLIAKARARPDLVKKVLDRARSGGWSQAFQAAQTRLSIPIPLGYSSAGMVDEVGPHVRGLAIGDRVAVAGAGYASHAEVNVAPEHLVARIESDLPFEEAAYATVAAIALQGLRVGGPAIGEIVAVVGLGLIGQITTQLLNAAGCRVVGVDPVAYRRKLAQKYGAEAVADPDTAEASIMHLSNGHGADSVYLTASADSNAPMESAGRLARKKGVVVVVGAVGMKVPRRSFYEKELDLRMSTSYGPGRYDAE